MNSERTTGKIWNWVIAILVVAIFLGGLVIWSKYQPAEPVEISIPPQPGLQGDIQISGAVRNPGIYPVWEGDSLSDLIAAAGGLADNATPGRVELRIPAPGEQSTLQKININRAEVWLLEALPEIGATRAQAIVDYRTRNGPFKTTIELIGIADIGPATFEKIKDLVSVAD